jgi:hypothetical protein
MVLLMTMVAAGDALEMLGWRRVVVNVGFLRVVSLLLLLAIVVAVRERRVIVRMGVPGGPVLEVVAEQPALVVMADMPMVVAMLNCRMRVLWFLALALGPLPDIGHCRASFHLNGYRNHPAWRMPAGSGSRWGCRGRILSRAEGVAHSDRIVVVERDRVS